VGWLILSIVAAIAPLLWGWQSLRRALPREEALDFLRLGAAAHWQEARLRELAGPVGDFVRTLLSEPSLAGRVDLLCERLAEVDSETSQIAEKFTMLVRTVLAVGGLLSVVIIGGAVRERAGIQMAWGLLPAALAACSAFWCYWMGRAVSRRVHERRRNWDTLCRLLERPHMSGSLPAGDAGSPGADVRRRREDLRWEKKSAMALAGQR
jgi:hypothetical protein